MFYNSVNRNEEFNFIIYPEYKMDNNTILKKELSNPSQNNYKRSETNEILKNLTKPKLVRDTNIIRDTTQNTPVPDNVIHFLNSLNIETRNEK